MTNEGVSAPSLRFRFRCCHETNGTTIRDVKAKCSTSLQRDQMPKTTVLTNKEAFGLVSMAECIRLLEETSLAS